MDAKKAKQTRVSVRTCYISVLNIILGFSFLVFQPHEIIRKYISIMHEDGGITLNLWRGGTSDNIYPHVKLYAFNITNADDFLGGKDEKLRLQEVGPYIYEEKFLQENLVFDHEKGIVSSTPKYWLEWAPHLNTRMEDEVLTLPNIAMLLFCSKVVDEYPLFTYLLNKFIIATDSRPIVQQTWRQFAFGFDTPFSSFGHKLFPNWIHFEKAGILDRLYDNHGDTLTTYTGENDFKLSSLIETYNGLPYLPQWAPPCDRITGSTAATGGKVGNDLTVGRNLYLFRKAICRAVPFIPREYHAPLKDSSFLDIPELLYEMPDDVFDNGQYNRENACFCRKGRCLPNGLSDITDCYYGFTVAISQPHFLNGDLSLLHGRVDGLKPDPHLHTSYFRVNKETGLVLDASIKFQVSSVLKDMADVERCDKFSNLILPMAWAELTPVRLPFLKKLGLFLFIRVLPVTVVVSSYFLIFIGVALPVNSYWRNNSSRPCSALKLVNESKVKAENQPNHDDVVFTQYTYSSVIKKQSSLDTEVDSGDSVDSGYSASHNTYVNR